MRRIRLTIIGVFLTLIATACSPGLSIFNPTDGSTVSGVITMDNEVTPDAEAGLDSVAADVDGTNLPLDANYDAQIDTETLTNGQHTLTANASNADGTTTASVTVNVQNPPRQGSVCVGGDSITYNSFNSSANIYERTFYGDVPEDLKLSYWMGWTHTDVQPAVDDWAANRDCEIYVDALGVNDSKPSHWTAERDGFSDTDKANVVNQLDTLHASSCKVLVQPGWGSGLGTVSPDDDPRQLDYELRYIQELEKVRQFYADLAVQRSDIVVVDWAPVIAEHPEYMNADGIHLESKTDGNPGYLEAASAARQYLYWEGVASCQAKLTAAP